jgi:uncharacterized protein YbbC (DUF1343 family)
MNSIEIQVGSGAFRKQIINGISEKDIRASWEPGLSQYKKMRRKYCCMINFNTCLNYPF